MKEKEIQTGCPCPIPNVLLSDMEETFKQCLETAKRKNADYAGDGIQSDPYKNFRGSEFVGVSPDRAILVRLMDKMSRVSNLLSQDAQVKDESIQDTLMDMVNYSAILMSYIKNNKSGYALTTEEFEMVRKALHEPISLK